MTTTTLSHRIILSFFVLFCAFQSKAITYQTMTSGNWNDVAGVWSTDGGASPCGCTPGAAPGANTVIVSHNISVPINLTISGGNLTVNPGGKMLGSYNLLVNNGVMDLYGQMTLTKYDQTGSSTVNLYPGAIMLASNAFTLNGGTFTMDGAVVNCGGLDLGLGATMNLTNASRFFIVSGNSAIDGILNIGPDCCMASNGNWRIRATGQVFGTGAFNSGGNINNTGFVDPSVIWCAQGTALGMLSPENCAGANGICNAITLPVELTDFSAVVYDNKFAEISWTTASEYNSSHFVLKASKDGKNWNDVALVQAAGNSSEEINYSAMDYDLGVGTTYYMLYQYDVDGRENIYDPISVKREAETTEILAFPNPVKNGAVLTITNVDDGYGQVQLLGLNGTPVQIEDFDAIDNEFEMNVQDVPAGVYLLHIQQNGTSNTTRVVVTR